MREGTDTKSGEGSTPNFLSHGFLEIDIQKFDDLLKRVKEPNFIVKIEGFLRKWS